jgi:hypothetical protein
VAKESFSEWVAWSNTRDCGRPHANIAGSIPAEVIDASLLRVSFIVAGRGLCEGPIAYPGESYRVCIIVCDL